MELSTHSIEMAHKEILITPNDSIGDVLRRMQAAGDDLSRPRNIDFTVVFPDGDAAAADKFANHFRGHGYTASVEFAETDSEFPWDVMVAKHMLPTHGEIAEFEASLQRVAGPLGGRNDGWGCLSEPAPSR